MSTLQFRELESLKQSYEAAHGPIHPAVLEMPPDIQLDLLKQADADGVILDAQSINAMLAGLDDRLALIRQLAGLVS